MFFFKLMSFFSCILSVIALGCLKSNLEQYFDKNVKFYVNTELKTNQGETIGSNSWKQCMPLKCSSESRARKNGFGPINLTEMEYRNTNPHFSRTSLVSSGKGTLYLDPACANRRKHHWFPCPGFLFNHNKD